MKYLLLRILHLERANLNLKAEIGRKDQRIASLLDEHEEMMRRYHCLLNECLDVRV